METREFGRGGVRGERIRDEGGRMKARQGEDRGRRSEVGGGGENEKTAGAWSRGNHRGRNWKLEIRK